MKRLLLAPLIFLLLSSIPVNAFWGESKPKKYCQQLLRKEISTGQIIKKLGLYMPRSIGGGRPFFKHEVETYCYRTLK